jgi:hypothetical protein
LRHPSAFHSLPRCWKTKSWPPFLKRVFRLPKSECDSAIFVGFCQECPTFQPCSNQDDHTIPERAEFRRSGAAALAPSGSVPGPRTACARGNARRGRAQRARFLQWQEWCVERHRGGSKQRLLVARAWHCACSHPPPIPPAPASRGACAPAAPLKKTVAPTVCAPIPCLSCFQLSIRLEPVELTVKGSYQRAGPWRGPGSGLKPRRTGFGARLGRRRCRRRSRRSRLV